MQENARPENSEEINLNYAGKKEVQKTAGKNKTKTQG